VPRQGEQRRLGDERGEGRGGARRYPAEAMSTAADCRANMTSRLATAKRAHDEMRAVLAKTPESEPEFARRDDNLVRDRFRSLLSELNNVRQYFGKWCDGQPGVNYKMRLDRFRDKSLASDDERRVWDEVRAARTADVHREPVSSERRKLWYHFATGEPGRQRNYFLSTCPYIARFTDNRGDKHEVQLQKFCAFAIRLTEKFVAEFDGNY